LWFYEISLAAMSTHFKIGDHVRWNSEAGRVSGVIIKKLTSDTKFKGYTHHASWEAPQYLIKSDKTEHVAIHKGTALRRVSARARKSGKTEKAKRG
jgi:Hypervirulence associated proteins TUDOR domain